MVGYVALFLSLFSIAFIQLRSAPSNFSWPISCQFRARTLGYTAIGFGSFSVLFTLFYPLALSAF